MRLSVALLPLAAAARDLGTPMHGTHIVRETYRGWTDSYRLDNGLIEVHVVTAVGPRIMDVRPSGGANLLYVRASEAGRGGESTWVQRGGWRLWVAPERTATTYALDNTPCRAEIVGATTLRVTGPPQPAAGVQKIVEVTLAPDAPRVRIRSRIRNVGDRPLTYAAWSLPAMQPGGRAFVPLDVGALTAFDATRRLILWSYTHFADPRYRFGDRLVEIDQRRVAPPPPLQPGRRDDESKIGTDTAQGWAAYLLDGTLFLERFAHDPAAHYPDGGATVEVYSSHEFLELEHLGPLTTIRPGEEIILPEDWWVFTNVQVPGAAADALEALNGYVARAPSP